MHLSNMPMPSLTIPTVIDSIPSLIASRYKTHWGIVSAISSILHSAIKTKPSIELLAAAKIVQWYAIRQITSKLIIDISSILSIGN